MGATLVLLRHGQSDWNKKNIFTGWMDVDLSEEGRKEALKARETLRHFHFDAVFTSLLKRAIETARLALGDDEHPRFYGDQALNERHYGELQGKNKDEARAQFGDEQVHIWRRSYTARPPGGESLADTYKRVLPYFESAIKPLLEQGKSVLVAAHGNSLRALIKYLDHLSDEEIVNVEIPTGTPIIYRFDQQGQVIEKHIKLSGEKNGQ